MNESPQTDGVDTVLHALEKLGGNTGGVVGTLFALAVLVLVVAVVAYKAWVAGREKAAADHQQVVDQEDSLSSELEADIAKLKAAQAAELANADLAEHDAEKQQLLIAAATQRFETAKDRISSAKSWDDLKEDL